MTELLEPGELTVLRNRVRYRVAAGYDERDEIIDAALQVVDWKDGVDEAAAEALVRSITDEELRDHLARQASWPATTDYDRLAAAFSQLERSGIVAREHFSCCSNCAATEIWDDVEAYGDGARGYTYFNQQTTDSAVDGGGLYLSYGSTQEGEPASLAIASEISLR